MASVLSNIVKGDSEIRDRLESIDDRLGSLEKTLRGQYKVENQRYKREQQDKKREGGDSGLLGIFKKKEKEEKKKKNGLLDMLMGAFKGLGGLLAKGLGLAIGKLGLGKIIATALGGLGGIISAALGKAGLGGILKAAFVKGLSFLGTAVFWKGLGIAAAVAAAVKGVTSLGDKIDTQTYGLGKTKKGTGFTQGDLKALMQTVKDNKSLTEDEKGEIQLSKNKLTDRMQQTKSLNDQLYDARKKKIEADANYKKFEEHHGASMEDIAKGKFKSRPGLSPVGRSAVINGAKESLKNKNENPQRIKDLETNLALSKKEQAKLTTAFFEQQKVKFTEEDLVQIQVKAGRRLMAEIPAHVDKSKIEDRNKLGHLYHAYTPINYGAVERHALGGFPGVSGVHRIPGNMIGDRPQNSFGLNEGDLVVNKVASQAMWGFARGGKIPCMLEDGETVVSKDSPMMPIASAFQASISRYQNGGHVGIATEHIKKDEQLSSLTAGKNDFIKPGGLSTKSNTPWGNIHDGTNVHAYGDKYGVPTIGWGNTFYDNISAGQEPVKMGDTITKKKADEVLYTNIAALDAKYASQMQYWQNMSNMQRAGILSMGYNAPNFYGTYPKVTAAIDSGNMDAVAQNLTWGGPSAARIAESQAMMKKGPQDVSKQPEKKQMSGLTPTESDKSWYQGMLGLQTGGTVYDPMNAKFQTPEQKVKLQILPTPTETKPTDTKAKPERQTTSEPVVKKQDNKNEGEGGAKAIVSLGKQLIEQGYTVREHPNFNGRTFDPTGQARVGGHSSGSLHYKDLALDVTDWRPGDWMGRTKGLAESLYQQKDDMKLSQIIHDPWGSWFGGGKGGAIGGHGTHLHLGFADGPGGGKLDPSQQIKNEGAANNPITQLMSGFGAVGEVVGKMLVDLQGMFSSTGLGGLFNGMFGGFGKMFGGGDAKDNGTNSYSGGGGAGIATGVEVAKNLMTDMNLSAASASGIVGNFLYESAGMKPDIRESGRGGEHSFEAGRTEVPAGYGWAQWSFDRHDEFVNKHLGGFNGPDGTSTRKATNKDNYDWLLHEFRNKEPIAGIPKEDPAEAAKWFRKNWERAGVPADNKRIAPAEEVFKKLQETKQEPQKLQSGGSVSAKPVSQSAIRKSQEQFLQKLGGGDPIIVPVPMGGQSGPGPMAFSGAGGGQDIAPKLSSQPSNNIAIDNAFRLSLGASFA